MPTWHLHIEGQVQGVGFRPFVYQLARQQGLCGWVNNTTDGVHVVFNADEQEAKTFSRTIIEKAPVLARISGHHLQVVPATGFDQFEIITSHPKGTTNLLISPDFALCPNCRRELSDPQNRRREYPFITCTHCGPRYSIIHDLPYDRETTTMATFPMCASCEQEYADPDDRRYYSQTNSCANCAIELSLWDTNQQLQSTIVSEIISSVVRSWQEGKIIAVKGIGGFLLTCAADQPDVIQELRRRKQRPAKPFAVMYPDIARVQQQMKLHEWEKAELLSARSPIVLLQPRTDALADIAHHNIAPGLSRIGVMIPYAPLLELLLRAYGRPVIATSANVSKAPIVYQDQEALANLSGIADHILLHNREIVVPQDDSLVQFCPITGQKIVLRRSRGMAPTFLQTDTNWPDESILATGAQLKSTFTLLHQRNTYISQYFGDLEHFDTWQSYRHSLQHFLSLLKAKPKCILIDSHPNYTAANYGRQMAIASNLSIETIYHHQAHFGAILGEHQLVDHPETILGVIWDGTGLGEDGMIWGGEFFTYADHTIQHCAQWTYFDHILGDKMPKEPRIAALASCREVVGSEQLLRTKFSATEWKLYSKMLQKDSNVQTSSMGRIFDAVASLLGLGDVQTFEGQAAMQLEELARSYVQQNGLDKINSYWPNGDLSNRLSTEALMNSVVRDLQLDIPKAVIAVRFHYTLVQSIAWVAETQNTRHIACSGGVFQNSLLVDLLIHHLGDRFQLYFHEELSPNDENISFGQLICYQISRRNNNLLPQNLEAHVLSNSR